MTNTDTRDVTATLTQIRDLAALGCQIVRIAVPDRDSVEAARALAEQSPIPVIADIHFDHRLALACIDAGVHGIRINPGNITREEHLASVAVRAGQRGIAVRLGVNSGSLPRAVLDAFGGPTADAMVATALRACSLFESHGCTALKVSLKTSRVDTTVAACRKFAQNSDLPLHLGVTEAGTPGRGIIKSAVGIGALLLDGIGDTVRVSLTAPPVEEIPAAIAILEAAGHRCPDPDVVACPTCGRTEIDLVGLASQVEKEIMRLKAEGWSFSGQRIAVMGCIVNGPGEARDATIGIAGGKGKGAIFRDGAVLKTVPEDRLLEEFVCELRTIGKPPTGSEKARAR